MKKLIRGIVEFRKNATDDYRRTFSRLAIGQSPDALFIACSDSRVAPNVFASTEPGDLLVVRNVGNMVPPSTADGISESDESEAAAIEFAITRLKVKDIIVCGHSECGAMQAALQGRERLTLPNLKSWLRLAEPALRKLSQNAALSSELPAHDLLSQWNVLEQLEHLRSYPIVREKIGAGELALHGWWFDIAKVDVYVYEKEFGRFTLLDETEASRILATLDR